MIKQVSLLSCMFVVFGTVSMATAATYKVQSPSNYNYEQYETRSTTRTYNVRNNDDVAYYVEPTKRSSTYRTYERGNNVRSGLSTTRKETVTGQVKRKYYLAHPFFQPTEGKFGSVTDLSYNNSSYGIHVVPLGGGSISDPDATWKMNGFSIKEDFSYGITNRFGILAMARYDSNDYKFDWKTAVDDTMDDSGLNMYGLGFQWRFVDNEKWISTLSAYYERQKDISNDLILELKAGYKVNRSTIYGFARGWYLDFDGNSYGNGITGIQDNGTYGALFIAYDDDASSALFVEGGIGVFSVVNEDWTLNLEGTLGHYDWHNQASVRGAIGWQPNDWFALSLYAKTSFFDTADDKNLNFWAYTESTPGVYEWGRLGTTSVDDYQEYSLGAQVIFYF